MVNGSTNTALRQVARVFQDGTLIGLSDRQMLERFVADRDEAAFEVLVARHGPMVLNVCKQLLRDPHDVEDAFQAVFLVLVRKAGMIRVEGSLGPWLYTVTHRIAVRARANRRRIAMREVAETAERAGSPPEDTLDRDETARAIQEELANLPDRLSAPLVLCYLQGMTHELAASQLGCPLGTVRSRLSRGRARLLARMTRRGLTLSAAALVSALETNVRAAAVPPILRAMLIRLATEWASGTAATVGAPGASASVAALLEGVLNVMRIKKLAIAATVLLGAGALGLVIANRAVAVGGAQLQESAQSSSDPFGRSMEPSGTPIGARPEKRDSNLITRTYYVGDIPGVTLSERPNSPALKKTNPPGSGVRPKIDMKPIMDLISSTVAPRTWQFDDLDTTRGVMGDASSTVAPRTWQIDDGSGQADRHGNRMVPFYLSISLIVRCPQEAHDQVGSLLRGLRDVLTARDAITARPDPSEVPKAYVNPAIKPSRPAETSPPAAPHREIQSAPLSLDNQPSLDQPGPTQRVQKLLDELQKEIKKLQPTNTVDTRSAPVQ
jgi:RNA polymerase sigma factor (sigma-70 family)